jgi:uncharacterized membrane protein
MKNKFFINIVFIVICLLTVYTCQKEKNAEDYYWVETKCANPWNTGENSSDSEVENAVIEYLENENIKVFNISINHENNLIELCKACNCNSGRRIIVSVDNENKIKEIGFKRY